MLNSSTRNNDLWRKFKLPWKYIQLMYLGPCFLIRIIFKDITPLTEKVIRKAKDLLLGFFFGQNKMKLETNVLMFVVY